MSGCLSIKHVTVLVSSRIEWVGSQVTDATSCHGCCIDAEDLTLGIDQFGAVERGTRSVALLGVQVEHSRRDDLLLDLRRLHDLLLWDVLLLDMLLLGYDDVLLLNLLLDLPLSATVL